MHATKRSELRRLPARVPASGVRSARFWTQAFSRMLDSRSTVNHLSFPRYTVGAMKLSTCKLKATTALEFLVEEASSKIRTGPPLEDDGDRTLPVWAGVLPLALRLKEPILLCPTTSYTTVRACPGRRTLGHERKLLDSNDSNQTKAKAYEDAPPYQFVAILAKLFSGVCAFIAALSWHRKHSN